MGKRTNDVVNAVRTFIIKDLWRTPSEQTPRWELWGRQVLKWLVVAAQGAHSDRLFLRASALTYVTILSIVPFLAVAFSVLKGVGFQNTELIRDLLSRVSAGREEVVSQIITYINNTNVRTLGVLGVAILFFTVINMLSNIEKTFNDVWGVQQSRSIGRKTADYISASILFPVLIATAISFTTTLQNYSMVQTLLDVSILNDFYLLLLKLVPYVASWLALMFLYVFIPNTRVRLGPAFAAGVVAGTVWQLAQWAYVTFQIGSAKYGAIYGSFAQLPLFLIWLYMSWTIVLVGAELCFAFQNLESVEKAAKFDNVSMAERQQVGLAVMLLLTRAFYDRKGGPRLETISRTVDTPENLLSTVLDVLRKGGLVGRLEEDLNERFTLTSPPDRVRVKDVLDCFMQHNAGGLAPENAPDYVTLAEAVCALDRAASESEYNATLAAMVGQEGRCG